MLKYNYLTQTEIFYLASIDLSKAEAVPDGGTQLNFEYEIDAKDFLKFAEMDIQNNDTRSLVNALSNSKRAIHCITDKILAIFKLKISKENFPEKLHLLEELGILTPRIISKVNKNRNLLEHHYKIPNKEKVEDAIDIAILFVAAIEGVLKNIWTEFILTDRNDDNGIFNSHDLVFVYKENKKIFEIRLHEDNKHFRSVVEPKDMIYKPLVKIMLSLDRNNDSVSEGVELIKAWYPGKGKL